MHEFKISLSKFFLSRINRRLPSICLHSPYQVHLMLLSNYGE